MPIRIYALAKELKIDSKELVEVCNKAGVTGKGSALASLDDDEVAKVKSYMSGPKTPAGGKSADSPKKADDSDKAPISREDYIPAGGGGGKIKVIPKKSGSKPGDKPKEADVAAETKPDAPAEDKPEEEAAPPTVSAESPAAPSEPAPPQKPAVDPNAPQRGAGIPQRGIGKIHGKPPVLQKTSKGVGKDKGGEQKPARTKRAPVIKVAKMPEAKQPSPQTKSDEPTPQKPEIRLSKDALVSHKKGKAPLEHLTTTGKGKGKGGGGGGAKTPDVPGIGEMLPDKPGRKRDRKSREAETPEDGTLLGMASARADRQKSRKSRQKQRVQIDREDDGGGGGGSFHQRRRRRTLQRTGKNTAAPRKGKVTLELPCTVRSFSEAAGVSSAEIQKTLMSMGTMATINTQLDEEAAEVLAVELGVELEFKQQETLEESVISQLEIEEDDEANMAPRPPVVTFLGHVDHGKTSLLDYLIGMNVVSGEAGGITQHIRAYKISTKDGRHVAFVDTPGHEAFTEMRARGANVTDIAVLVIAADDGIMPQTEEAISHAKAAGVPIVVALNKMDLPGADPNRVMTQLTEYELTPSEWGGETEIVQTSAISGDGMDDLLETLLTIAELHEYQANAERTAIGTCLEAEQEGGRGVLAKMIVQHGTLKVGDIVVCGAAHGRVKAMYDTIKPDQRIEEAGPSTPVNLLGLDIPPEAGDRFYVLSDISQARQIAESRATRTRGSRLAGTDQRISFEDFQARLADGQLDNTGEVVNLNLIVRADVRGSIEAIQKELQKLEHPEVQVRVLQASVGGITAADVTLGHASQAVIIGFNVIPDEAARGLADEYGVEIRRYDVIYKVTDDIRAMLEGKLKPEERIVELGRALVKQVFSISRVGSVAGCYVAQGQVERGCRIRVNRDGRTIGDYPLDSLRREKEDVKEVNRGMECGIKLSGFDDVKKDDVLEAYKIEEVARTL